MTDEPPVAAGLVRLYLAHIGVPAAEFRTAARQFMDKFPGARLVRFESYATKHGTARTCYFDAPVRTFANWRWSTR